MSLALIIGFPGSGKTWDAASAADAYAKTVSEHARVLAWGPRFEYWPRLTISEWQANPIPRAVLDDNAPDAIRYAIDACNADAACAVVIDEAHRIFRGDEPEAANILCEMCREHRHMGRWYVATQNLVGLPSEIEADANFLVIHHLAARVELPRLRVYEDYAWRTPKPEWAGDMTLSQIAGDARIGHGAVIVNRESAVLGWRPCSCASHPEPVVETY